MRGVRNKETENKETKMTEIKEKKTAGKTIKTQSENTATLLSEMKKEIEALKKQIETSNMQIDSESRKPGDPFFLFGDEIKPYEGKDKLEKGKVNKKGQVIKPGEPRFYVVRHNNDYKLIKIYNARSIKRRLVVMIKPYKRTEKGQRDKKLFSILKDLNIPGAI